MLSEFNDMWDGHLDQFNAVRHRIDLAWPEVQPRESALYRTTLGVFEFQWDEIDKMLEVNVMDPVQVDWAVPILIALKLNGALYFRVDYKNSTPSRSGTLTIFLGSTNLLAHLEMHEYFRFWMRTIKSGKSKSTKKLAMKRHSRCNIDFFASSVCLLDLKIRMGGSIELWTPYLRL